MPAASAALAITLRMPTGPSYVLRSSLRLWRSSSFSLPAKIEIGRVCGTSDIIDPIATKPVMSSLSAKSMNSAANACQARAGSTPVSSHSWVPRGRADRAMQRRLRPLQQPPAIGLGGDLRTRVLVVEVQLGVDRERGFVRSALAQLRQRGGGSLARVVPAVERGHEHSASQSVHTASS